MIAPVQDLKVNVLGNKNPRLHIDELLVALSICAVTDPNAKRAVQQLQSSGGARPTPPSSSPRGTRTASAAWASA